MATMPPRKNAGEGSKKAQGQARKAEAAAQKQAGKQKEVEAAEAKEWEKGAKSNTKAYVCYQAFALVCTLTI